MNPDGHNSEGADRGAMRPARAAVVARPELWQRLDASGRVAAVSAPAGSGKTVLLRSWITESALQGRVAWIPVDRGEQDPQHFWLSVLDELRRTIPGRDLVRALTAAPDLDGWAIVERLLTDLSSLPERLWLVIDDLHELDSDQARRQLELLILRAPAALRFVLVARRDLRLGLHRLRVEGELTEIRAGDLRFSAADAQTLFEAAGIQLTDRAVKSLVARTEGWAAGLRLAALSLAGQPDPERFAAEFYGSERTVAEYLLAEVLDQQPAGIRKLLLRTSVLERVNGELADLLTGGTDGERVLQDLVAANAFVMPLDAARTWFRYHQLFAELLRLELRRTEPEKVARLNQLASSWFAEHRSPVEAVRHAQQAGEWALASRLLADHWLSLYLDGQAATVEALLAEFPDQATIANSELAALAAANAVAQGSLSAAERQLLLAERGEASVPAERRDQALALLGIARLLLAWFEGDLPTVIQQADRLDELLDAPAAPLASPDELRALVLIGRGDAEIWTGQIDLAELHLDQALTLARQIGRPYLEFLALTHRAEIELSRRFGQAAELGRQAVNLADQHGWTDETTAGLACMTLGSGLAWTGQLDEAATWLQQAERTIRPDAAPASAMGVQYNRGQVDLARGRFAEALTAFQSAQRLAGQLAAPHPLARPMKAWMVHALARLGDTAGAEKILADLSDHARARGEVHIAVAVLRLAQGDQRAAATELAPVLGGSARVGWKSWLVEAYLLEAIIRDALGDQAAAGQAMERALGLTEPEGTLMWFLLHAAPGLLERQARQGTAHPALVTKILDLLAGRSSAPSQSGAQPLIEPLSGSELRVLRYLPTHLSAPEIAAELSVSPATVRTHLRNLYLKLGVHSRAEAVERARALLLLAPLGSAPSLKSSRS
jgi:LuxR family transcriptional regulator, maltose regulon positive regulatory protein